MNVARALVVIAVALASTASWACPVCGSAKADNDWMFGVTTVILSLLPLSLFGGFVFFVARAYKRAAREERIAPPAE